MAMLGLVERDASPQQKSASGGSGIRHKPAKTGRGSIGSSRGSNLTGGQKTEAPSSDSRCSSSSTIARVTPWVSRRAVASSDELRASLAARRPSLLARRDSAAGEGNDRSQSRVLVGKISARSQSLDRARIAFGDTGCLPSPTRAQDRFRTPALSGIAHKVAHPKRTLGLDDEPIRKSVEHPKQEQQPAPVRRGRN